MFYTKKPIIYLNIIKINIKFHYLMPFFFFCFIYGQFLACVERRLGFEYRTSGEGDGGSRGGPNQYCNNTDNSTRLQNLRSGGWIAVGVGAGKRACVSPLLLRPFSVRCRKREWVAERHAPWFRSRKDGSRAHGLGINNKCIYIYILQSTPIIRLILRPAQSDSYSRMNVTGEVGKKK